MNLSPEQLAELKKKVDYCVDSLIRIEAEKGLIKEVADDVKDKFEIATSDFNRIVKTVHKDNLEDEREKAENVFHIVERILG